VEAEEIMVTPQAMSAGLTEAVTRLARRCDLSVDEVAELYERQRDELAAVARVTTFLDVFVARNVEQILRQRNA
jgi:hypothetical protein